MIVSGHQPNYLPWLGFFDKLKCSDIFIIEDNVQFERQGFTNRNRIKTINGVRWLTVPIEHANRSLLIKEVRIANSSEPAWARRHWLTLKHSYCKAPYWKNYYRFFEDTYNRRWTKLTDLNMHLIRGIMRFLDIHTQIVLGSSLGVRGRKSDLIVAQCQAVGANIQLAGTGGRGYIEPRKFRNKGIKVLYQNFFHPTYRQVYGDFTPGLSVVDYLFCVGAKKW